MVIAIVIIVVVLILCMGFFMFASNSNSSYSSYSNSNSSYSSYSNSSNSNSSDGYTVLAEASTKYGHRILAVQYVAEPPFLVYNSISTLGRWNLFCGNENMEKKKYGVGFNLSMELQQFLDNIKPVQQLSLADLLSRYPDSQQDNYVEVYEVMIKTNELAPRKFTKELASVDKNIIKDSAKVMENNFKCMNDHTKIYNKKLTVYDDIFDIDYMKVSLIENVTNDKFILYYIDYRINSPTLPKFNGNRYNAPIYIEYVGGVLNQYGMNKPWVNPYGYVHKIIEQASDKSSITFMGNECNNLWPLASTNVLKA